MALQYNLLEDYDKHYKMHKSEISCYSKKELDQKYPQEEYSIVGEIRGKLFDPDKVYDNEPTTIALKNKEYIVECPRSNNKLIYSRYRYINVGDDKYVVLLKNRLPFFLLFLLLLIGIILSSVLIFNLLHEKPNELLQIQPKNDKNVEEMLDDDSEKVSSPAGGGSVSMEYALFAKVSLSSGKIQIHFKNPNESNQNVALQLYVVSGEDEVMIAKSGTIPPRSKISQLTLLPSAKEQLREGTYTGRFKIGYYDPETGEKAVIDSALEGVEITVTQ